MSYPWKNISPKDGYAVRRTSDFSSTDQRILTLLYKPLIGTEAYGLLMTWIADTDRRPDGKDESLLSHLLSLQNFGVPDFYQARVKLEAVGLVKTYVQKEQSFYVHELYPPLSAQAFFTDDILQLLLLNQVGEQQFKKLKEQFLYPKWPKETFTEITRSFPEVYQFEWGKNQASNLKAVNQQEEQDYQMDGKKVSVNWDKRSLDFDWKFFLSSLRNQFVDLNSVEKERETIEMLYMLYGPDELKMSQYILEAAEPETGKLDAGKLKSIVHRDNRSKTGSQKSTTVVPQKSESAARYTNYPPEIAQLLSISENRNPADFLISIKQQKGGFLTKVEQWTLEDIVGQSGLTAPVINILIHYILVIKGNPVFERNLAYKIANDWAQSGIRTPVEAIEKVQQLYASSNQQKQTGRTQHKKSSYGKPSSAKKETLPDWAKERTGNEKETDKPLSKEEQLEFKERLKKIRNFQREGE